MNNEHLQPGVIYVKPSLAIISTLGSVLVAILGYRTRAVCCFRRGAHVPPKRCLQSVYTEDYPLNMQKPGVICI